MKRNFGFIREKLEIKILILFILRRLPEPVSFDMLTELTLCDDGISYFDYTECVAELVKTEHIRLKDEKYSLTEKGIRNGTILEDSLPGSIRSQVESSTVAARRELSRNSQIKTFYTANPNGSCKVTMTLSDGIGDVASVELLAGSKQQARALIRGFRKNAENIYNAIIELILN